MRESEGERGKDGRWVRESERGERSGAKKGGVYRQRAKKHAWSEGHEERTRNTEDWRHHVLRRTMISRESEQRQRGAKSDKGKGG